MSFYSGRDKTQFKGVRVSVSVSLGNAIMITKLLHGGKIKNSTSGANAKKKRIFSNGLK